MKTIPDSNVLFDIILKDPVWFDWAAKRFTSCALEGPVVVNTIVFAEVGAHFLSESETHDVLGKMGVELEHVTWEAAYRAGRAHRAYRKAGGQRERILPDFLVGAHAEVKDYRILTRDKGRYRAYFPDISLIAPDTHP